MIFVQKYISMGYPVGCRSVASDYGYRLTARKRIYCRILRYVCPCYEVACKVLYCNGNERNRAWHKYCKPCQKRRQAHCARILLLVFDNSSVNCCTACNGYILSQHLSITINLKEAALCCYSDCRKNSIVVKNGVECCLLCWFCISARSAVCAVASCNGLIQLT